VKFVYIIAEGKGDERMMGKKKTGNHLQGCAFSIGRSLKSC